MFFAVRLFLYLKREENHRHTPDRADVSSVLV